MIKFNKNEIKYIKDSFKKFIDIDSCNDEGFKRHYLNLNKEIIEYIHIVFKNIEKINNDEDINQKCVEALTDAEGLWYWNFNGFSLKDIERYVNCKEYVSIYKKIYDVEED